MQKETEKVIQLKRKGQTILERKRELFFERLFSLSPERIVNFILEQKNAKQIVQEFTTLDLYWLLKKIGEEDFIPILELASKEQWQYILDMEIWNRDRFDVNRAAIWLRRFMEADAEKLANWLITDDMEMFTYYFFYRTLEVVVVTDDNVYELSEDYFTLDNTFYMRIKDDSLRDVVEDLLKIIAGKNFLKYQALLMTSRAILPASTEEELYRLRSVRIAEYGFLPFEEAISIYSPINPEKLIRSVNNKYSDIIVVDNEIREIIPVFPIHQLQTKGIFHLMIHSIKDNILMDRIRLEFVGLCNQLISADALFISDFEDIIKVCKKAAGYLNIAIEDVCNNNVHKAIELVKHNSFVSIFRVGFGLTLKLRWEVEKWLKKSWFKKQGLSPDFWGEEWGNIIKGLLKKRPMYYVGIEQGEEYRFFESLSELRYCENIFFNLQLLDKLFENITDLHPIEKTLITDPTITFHPFLFTFWARKLLGLKPGFHALTMDQVKEFFRILRSKDTAFPYKMEGFKGIFLKEIGAYMLEYDIEKILSSLWDEFCDEYKNIEIQDIDERYVRFLIIK